MAEKVKVGDRGAWSSSGERRVGKVAKKQTSPTKIKGHEIAASKDNPEYIVESEKSGKEAARKGSALKKV
jgi:hypothetical protein